MKESETRTTFEKQQKPPLTEIFAWNENIFGLVALSWGVSVSLLSDSPLREAGIFIAGGGLSLMCLQIERLRILLDFQVPAFILKNVPPLMRGAILKMWPTSVLLRAFSHFFFTVWWMLIGIIVLIMFDGAEDVRFIFYFGFATLHFDRLIRLIRWMRH